MIQHQNARNRLRIELIGARTSGGTFYSAARHRRAGYTVAYPPGHRRGDRLPLVIMLHGYGDNHASALVGLSPETATGTPIRGTTRWRW